jgi:hypothetical protein
MKSFFSILWDVFAQVVNGEFWNKTPLTFNGLGKVTSQKIIQDYPSVKFAYSIYDIYHQKHVLRQYLILLVESEEIHEEN